MNLSASTTTLLKNTFALLNLSTEHMEAYITLLQKGSCTTTKLAKYSDIPRTNFYSLLEDLDDWGLISTNIEKNRTLYEAKDPYILIDLLQSQKNKFDDTFYNLKRNIHELENLYKNSFKVNEDSNNDTGINETKLIQLLKNSKELFIIVNSNNNETLLMLDSVLDLIEKNCKSIKELIFSATEEYIKERKMSKVSEIKFYNDSNRTRDSIKIISEDFVLNMSGNEYLLEKNTERIALEEDIFKRLWKMHK